MKSARYFSFFLVLLFLGNAAGSLRGQTSEEQRLFVYANRLMSDKMFDLAADQFLDYVQKYGSSPRAPEAQFLAGQCLYKEGKFNRAIQAFQTLILRYPQFQRLDEAQLTIGKAYEMLGFPKKAAESFENLPLYYPKSSLAPQALMRAAAIYEKLGRTEKSRELWIRVVKEFPESTWVDRARLKLAESFRKSGDLATSLRYLDRVSQSKNAAARAQALLKKGAVFEELGRLSAARGLYQQVAADEAAPQNFRAQAYVLLGLLNEKLGNWTAAKGSFQSGLPFASADTTRLAIQLQLAKTNFVLGDFPESLRLYKSVAEASGDSLRKVQALFGAAVSSEKMLDFEGALGFLETIRQMKRVPRPARPFVEKAELHEIDDFLSLKKFQSARGAMEIFLKRFPQSPRAARVSFQLARLDETNRKAYALALKEYDQVLKDFPRSVFADDAAFGVARCEEKLGQKTAALSDYRKFLLEYPGSPLLPQALKRLEWYNRYENTDLEGSVKRLASLMASVLLEKGREDALYALFKLNFEQLKDYGNTVALGQLILKERRAPDYIPQILFQMGKAYQYLAEANPQNESATAYRDSADSIYGRFLSRFPTNGLAADVLFQKIELEKGRGTPLAEYRALSKLLLAYPESAQNPQIFFRLGQTLLEVKSQIPADSTGNAGRYFEKVVALAPHSLWADRAMSQLAEQAFRSGHFAEAASQFTRYLKVFPNGLSAALANFRLAELFQEQRKFKKALNAYESVVRNFYYTDFADSAQTRLGDIYFQLGQYSRALQVFDQVRKIHPEKEADFQFARGLILVKQNKPVQAVQALRQYVANYPNGRHVADALKLMADISKKSGDLRQAAEIYTLVLASNTNPTFQQEVRRRLADIQFEQENFAAALKNYQQLLTSGSDDLTKPELKAREILCLIHLGKIAQARKETKTFEKSYKAIGAYLAEIYYNFGNYYVEQKNFDRAVKNYKLVAGKYKHTKWRPYGEYGIGRVYLVTNKVEKALKILTPLPRKYPKSQVLPLVYLTLGDFYYKSKQFDNALAAFKQVLAHNPSQKVKKTAMRYLMKVYSDLGMWDSALTATRQFIQAFPDDPDVFNQKIQMAIYTIRLQEYDRAIDYLKKLLPQADAETEAEIQYWIGESYYKMGQFERAISEFLKVRYMAKPSKLPWDVTAEYEAGLAYLKLNRPEKARAIFEKIVKERGAGSDYGKVALKRIQEIDAGLRGK